MAVDMFLKLDGIKGESKDAKHKDEIHIESFSWGLSQTGAHGSGGGGGAGKVSVHDISVTKFLDKASPELMLACCNGKHIKEGLITVRKAGENPVEYLKIKLSDILISGVQDAGHGSDLLTENVTLNFAKFHVDYQEQGKDGKAAGGPVSMGWDVKANTKA
jgi:type VI secretion system secreted protein Hcp